jgi:predicted Abi (CAAX) family protease
VRLIWRELVIALRSWPDKQGWWRTVKTGIPALLLIALLAWAGRFADAGPDRNAHDPSLLATMWLFFAALANELVFRGLLMSAAWRLSKRWAAWITVIAFAATYPLQAVMLGFGSGGLYFYPGFIIAAFLCGMVLAHVRIVAQSLWPAIALHWLLLLCWYWLS